MLTRLLLAVFLLAHAGIHAGFLSPQPQATAGGPQWPFDLSRSWILTPLRVPRELTRLLGMALVGTTVGAFVLAAVATVGLLPAGIWAPAVAVGVVASASLLILFFHRWLIFGFIIDTGLLWAVLVAGWTPQATAAP